MLPYLVLATLVGGTIWRYRYDKFGWTTRSSQLYESRLLRIGSPLFHFGILLVLVGHVGGLVIPESWTEAVGVSEGIYHFNALLFGGIAGRLHPRRDRDPGLPPAHDRAGLHGHHQERQGDVRRAGRPPSSLGPVDHAGQRRRRPRGAQLPRDASRRGSARSSCCSPTSTSMAAAPIQFHVHVLVGMLLFALWPFTRLVHAFTAPVHYLFRPYIVYRSRDARTARRPRRPRGLEPGRHPRPRPRRADPPT